MIAHALRVLLRGGALLAGVLLVLEGGAYLLGSFWIQRTESAAVDLPADVPGRLLDVGAHPVHLVERGSGPPLLLVHGFAGSTYDWEEYVLAPLAATNRIVALDLYGMGFSDRDDAMDYGLDLWTEQLRGTLDSLGLEQTAIACHSMGCAIAAAFAVAHPERVERLVMVAPLVPVEDADRAFFFRVLGVPGAGEAMLGWLDHLPALPGFSDAYHQRSRMAFRIRGTRHALLRWVRHGYDPARIADDYRRISVPTVIVAGRADDIVPWTDVERTARSIDGALVLPLDGVGHWLLRDSPDRVIETVRTFTSSSDRVAPLPAASLQLPP